MRETQTPVVVFTNRLLPPSETFIKGLEAANSRHVTHFIGCRRVPGIALPMDRSFTIDDGSFFGRIKDVIFKFTGRSAALDRILQKISPALVHAQFGGGGVVCLPFTRRLHIPLIVRYHGGDATQNPETTRWASLTHWLYARRRHALYREAYLLLAVSDFIKKKLIADGAASEKIRILYVGIDTVKFRPDPAVTEKKHALFVGRLDPTKGCADAITAMGQIQAQFPGVRLQIAGDGPLRAELESLAKQQGTICDFLGIRPHDEIVHLMQHSVFLLAPSATATDGRAEGLPTVILEALSCGLPVVSTYHAGIPEAVQHNITGLLAPEHDVAMLASHGLRLLTDPSLRQSIAQAARKLASERFSLERQSSLLEEIYDEISAKFPREVPRKKTPLKLAREQATR